MSTYCLEQQIEDRLQEITDYLDEAPYNLSTVIFHDALYELSYQSVMDDLADASEARAEEERYGDYDEQD